MATPAKVSFPTTQCTICLEDVEEPTTALNCGHVFCYGCISHWLRRHNRCPLCRSVVIRLVRQVIEDGIAVERTENVIVAEGQEGFALNMGMFTQVQTPADSPINMVIPVNIPPSPRYFYRVRLLEADQIMFFTDIERGTLFVLPEDLPGVVQVLESHNIFCLDLGIHDDIFPCHATFLEDHGPHQGGN